MALIGEPEGAGDLHRRLTLRQQPLRPYGQAQLDQIRMRREPKGGLERVRRKRSTPQACARSSSPMSSQAWACRESRATCATNGWRGSKMLAAPIKVTSERPQQGVDGALAHNAQVTLMERVERSRNSSGQSRILAQGVGKPRLTVGGARAKRATPLQPVRIEVEHGIGKAFLGRRMPVVDLPELSMKTLPGVLRWRTRLQLNCCIPCSVTPTRKLSCQCGS